MTHAFFSGTPFIRIIELYGEVEVLFTENTIALSDILFYLGML